MYFEALYWTMDDPLIKFSMIKGAGSASEAMLESANYYSQYKFEKLRGLDEIHPFQMIKNYCQQTGSRFVDIKKYASFRRIQVEYIRSELINFAIKGFVIYYPDKDQVFVKDKVFDYLNANIGRTDYDVIQFHSIIEAEDNATLNLLNWDLKMKGVSRVFKRLTSCIYLS